MKPTTILVTAPMIEQAIATWIDDLGSSRLTPPASERLLDVEPPPSDPSLLRPESPQRIGPRALAGLRRRRCAKKAMFSGAHAVASGKGIDQGFAFLGDLTPPTFCVGSGVLSRHSYSQRAGCPVVRGCLSLKGSILLGGEKE